MAKEKKDSTQSWTKKTWYQIYSRKSLNEAFLGESLAFQPHDLFGKLIGVNLMNLTGDLKKQHITVKFKIQEYKDNKLYADPFAMIISPSAIKRHVRRGKDRLDDSFFLKSKDNILLRVKPLIVTKTNTKSSVLKLIRKVCYQALSLYISKNDIETIFKDAMSLKLHSTIRGNITKIYPLRLFEIKYLGIEESENILKEEQAAAELSSQNTENIVKAEQ
jgi:ribosomal protein S3AE